MDSEGARMPVSAGENVKTDESFASRVPDRGGVAVIVLGNLLSSGLGDMACADEGVSG